MRPIAFTDDPKSVASLLDQVVMLANRDKEALGFLSTSVFKDACAQRRMIVATDGPEGQRAVVGYVMFGGVFPHARIYQVAVDRAARRSAVGTRLLDSLVHRLEAEGYLSLTARVANDLGDALAFYTRCGFVPIKTVAGGSSRARQLSVLAKSLRSDDLFSIAASGTKADRLVALALRASRPGDAPFYVFDLNVLFDLLRVRARTANARKLFGAALAHKIRLAVTPEFLVELKRTALASVDDVVLQMALQLPHLTDLAEDDLAEAAARVHRIVFEDTNSKQAGTPQSISDARHVAHAALARASAYITSDRAILNEKARLRYEVGIDVASLDELVELVADDVPDGAHPHTRGQGFEVAEFSPGDAEHYFSTTGQLRTALPLVKGSGLAVPKRMAVRRGGDIIAVCVLLPPTASSSSARLVLHPNPRWMDGANFLDALFDRAVTQATAGGPMAIELVPIEDETLSLITSFAQSKGFLRASSRDPFSKVALGRTLTPQNWEQTAETLRRRTGLALLPLQSSADHAAIEMPGRETVQVAFPRLEDILSPAIVAWPERRAVIQPIASHFAGELLGSSKQPSLLDSHTASFLSRRTYVSTPRAARFMVPGSMIFFYESQRTGGVGAIVAVARIVDSLTASKHALPRKELDHVVVEDVDRLTKSEDVLLTSFDNLLVLPSFVALRDLRKLNAVGSQNLQSTTPITFESATAILEIGWKRNAH